MLVSTAKLLVCRDLRPGRTSEGQGTFADVLGSPKTFVEPAASNCVMIA